MENPLQTLINQVSEAKNAALEDSFNINLSNNRDPGTCKGASFPMVADKNKKSYILCADEDEKL